MLSAYSTTMPCSFRAARPMVWMSEVSERRKPSLSASRMATSDTSGNIESLTQQVDADKHIVHAETQITHQLLPLDGLNIVVHVAHLDARGFEVISQILGHFLGERGDQNPFSLGCAGVDFANEIVDLTINRTDNNLRIKHDRSDG